MAYKKISKIVSSI